MKITLVDPDIYTGVAVQTAMSRCTKEHGFSGYLQIVESADRIADDTDVVLLSLGRPPSLCPLAALRQQVDLPIIAITTGDALGEETIAAGARDFIDRAMLSTIDLCSAAQNACDGPALTPLEWRLNHATRRGAAELRRAQTLRHQLPRQSDQQDGHLGR